MLKLIIGGASSGKSAFAQRLIEEDFHGSRKRVPDGASKPYESGGLIYLATMAADDGESRKRIKRHVAMREDKGYRTIEAARDIGNIADQLGEGSFVLLEDIPNLCANEMFSEEKRSFLESLEAERSPEKEALFVEALSGKITCDIEKLCDMCLCGEVVSVTGNLFADGKSYEGATLLYLKVLARVNYALAQKAEYVSEIVCGYPNVLKDELSRSV